MEMMNAENRYRKSKERDKSWQMTREFKTITTCSFLFLNSKRQRLFYDFVIAWFT